jgi:hypothetical protein
MLVILIPIIVFIYSRQGRFWFGFYEGRFENSWIGFSFGDSTHNRCLVVINLFLIITHNTVDCTDDIDTQATLKCRNEMI